MDAAIQIAQKHMFRASIVTIVLTIVSAVAWGIIFTNFHFDRTETGIDPVEFIIDSGSPIWTSGLMFILGLLGLRISQTNTKALSSLRFQLNFHFVLTLLSAVGCALSVRYTVSKFLFCTTTVWCIFIQNALAHRMDGLSMAVMIVLAGMCIFNFTYFCKFKRLFSGKIVKPGKINATT